MLCAAGTLAFWFRTSRTVHFASEKAKSDKANPPPPLLLADCPLLRAELSESRSSAVLRITLLTDGKPTPRRSRSLMWSRLEGGRWYHLAIAWDAAAGALEAYLNGVLQETLSVSGPDGPWRIPSPAAGALRVGGSAGQGRDFVKASVDSIALYSAFMDQEAVAAALKGRNAPMLNGEGRTEYSGELDLASYKLQLVYDADFNKPLNVVYEDELFEGDRRTRLPVGKEWVLEGPGRAWAADKRLWLESDDPDGEGHVVLWSTRIFPENFLLEFDMSPMDSAKGLNIVFFSAASRQGGGIFDLDLPRRGGLFQHYHSGAIDGYHTSYWAAGRRTANVRKNFGFYLVDCGCDRIDGQGPGPHRVRVLKAGGKLRLEVGGRLACAFDDDGATYGPVLKSGAIGLRQMAHTHRASYGRFRVWAVEPRPAGR